MKKILGLITVAVVILGMTAAWGQDPLAAQEVTLIEKVYADKTTDVVDQENNLPIVWTKKKLSQSARYENLIRDAIIKVERVTEIPDASITRIDESMLVKQFKKFNFDCNKDGKIDDNDFKYLMLCLDQMPYGDRNKDGIVNVFDYHIVIITRVQIIIEKA